MKRRNFLKGSVVVVAGTGIAGCAEQDRTRSEIIEDEFKAHQWLGSGEGLAVQFGEDQWRITVDAVGEKTADLVATKYTMDESGANKEGGSGAIDITRTDVEVGERIEFEPDCIAAVVCHDGDEVEFVVDDYVSDGDIDKVICDE